MICKIFTLVLYKYKIAYWSSVLHVRAMAYQLELVLCSHAN